MTKKRCPTCKKNYYPLDNYCTKCGIGLETVPNKCGESKTARCEHLIFEQDDVYCSSCGALTTYAIENQR